MGREGSWVNEWCDMVVSRNQNKICGDLTLLEIAGVLWRRIQIPIDLAIKGNKGYDQARYVWFFSCLVFYYLLRTRDLI